MWHDIDLVLMKLVDCEVIFKKLTYFEMDQNRI